MDGIRRGRFKILVRICIILGFLSILMFIYEKNICEKERIRRFDIPGIEYGPEPVRGENNIFFIETSCGFVSCSDLNRAISLNERQACSIESAVDAHPEAKVYVLHTCHMTGHFIQNAYDRIFFTKINLPGYFLNTPLETAFRARIFEDSEFPVEHLSDVLRLLTLWKYGGIYIDMDFIVNWNLDDLGKNFLTSYDADSIANGVIAMSIDDQAKAFLEDCLNEIKRNFRGKDWIFNGSDLLTRLLKKKCNAAQISDLVSTDCEGIKIHAPDDFYSVPLDLWETLFAEDPDDAVVELLEQHAMVHMWNKISHGRPVVKHRHQPYSVLAKKNCPLVYETAGRTF